MFLTEKLEDDVKTRKQLHKILNGRHMLFKPINENRNDMKKAKSKAGDRQWQAAACNMPCCAMVISSRRAWLKMVMPGMKKEKSGGGRKERRTGSVYAGRRQDMSCLSLERSSQEKGKRQWEEGRRQAGDGLCLACVCIPICLLFLVQHVCVYAERHCSERLLHGQCCPVHHIFLSWWAWKGGMSPPSLCLVSLFSLSVYDVHYEEKEKWQWKIFLISHQQKWKEGRKT